MTMPRPPRSPSVAGATPLVAAALALTLAAGCAERTPPPAAATDTHVRHEGFVRVADGLLPVAPFIIHDPKQDLFTLCRIGSDAARDAGTDLPLCYDPTPRERAALKHLRVEIIDASIGRAMQTVAAIGDGAHFAVDRTGTIYQVLDLAYPARRAGAVRPDEIRVISTAPAAHDGLVAVLKGLWPKLRVEVVAGATPPRPSLPQSPPGGPR